MNHPFFFLLCIMVCTSGFSQGKKDTLQLFYDLDAAVSEANNRRIDSLSTALKDKVYNVWIYGYADFVHSDGYNKTLSQRRADGVRTRLLQNSSEPQLTILACEGRGEKNSSDNGTAEGEPGQRRVDLIYEIRSQNRVVDTRPVKLKPREPAQERTREQLEAKPIDVKELKEKGKLALEGLSFVPGRSTLMKKSVPVLHSLLNTMLQNPELRIEIQGHICCWKYDGDAYDYDTDNMMLSHNRAKTVYDFLVENGVDADRLEYKGYGHSRPRAKEVSPETEQVNRRVEIRVLE